MFKKKMQHILGIVKKSLFGGSVRRGDPKLNLQEFARDYLDDGDDEFDDDLVD